MDRKLCYSLPGGRPNPLHDTSCEIWKRFTNLFETSQSLFWASFGLVELYNFELTGIKSYTRFWAMLMFGCYSVINVVVLLNLLIAMMSSSYQIISEHSDTEWKFARSKLWMSYFEKGDTVPPPFNILPSSKIFFKIIPTKGKKPTNSIKMRAEQNRDAEYAGVMRCLVRRYVTAEQRRSDASPVTEDHVNEVKQDIATFRYELFEILRANGMHCRNISYEKDAAGKKEREFERRLLKDFNIGLVQSVVGAVLRQRRSVKRSAATFDVLRRVTGRRLTAQRNWNAIVEAARWQSNQIGCSSNCSNSGSLLDLKELVLNEQDSAVKSVRSLTTLLNRTSQEAKRGKSRTRHETTSESLATSEEDLSAISPGFLTDNESNSNSVQQINELVKEANNIFLETGIPTIDIEENSTTLEETVENTLQEDENVLTVFTNGAHERPSIMFPDRKKLLNTLENKTATDTRVNKTTLEETTDSRGEKSLPQETSVKQINPVIISPDGNKLSKEHESVFATDTKVLKKTEPVEKGILQNPSVKLFDTTDEIQLISNLLPNLADRPSQILQVTTPIQSASTPSSLGSFMQESLRGRDTHFTRPIEVMGIQEKNKHEEIEIEILNNSEKIENQIHERKIGTDTPISENSNAGDQVQSQTCLEIPTEQIDIENFSTTLTTDDPCPSKSNQDGRKGSTSNPFQNSEFESDIQVQLDSHRSDIYPEIDSHGKKHRASLAEREKNTDEILVMESVKESTKPSINLSRRKPSTTNLNWL